MKRLWYVALLVLGVVGIAGASDFPKPTAEITRFEVDSISLRDVTFMFELTVKNPYPVALKFSGMDMDFIVEGNKVFHAASQGGFSVKAKGKKANTFTVTLTYDSIIKLVKDYASRDYLDTKIDGNLVIPLPKIPGVPKDITFTYALKKKIPAIKPTLSVTGFKVLIPTQEQIAASIAKAGSKVSPGKAFGVFKDVLSGKKPADSVFDPSDIDVPLTVSYTIEIRNEAKAPLSFNAVNYELFVNGDSLVSGDSTSVERRGDTTFITVTNVFSSKQLTKSVKALFVDRKGSFKVNGKAKIQLPEEIRREPIPLGFSETGSFKL